MNSRIIFFIIIISMYTFLNVYVCIRGLQALPNNNIAKYSYLSVFIFLSVSLIIAFALEAILPFGTNSFLQTIGSSWLVILFYAFLFVLFFDILRLTNHWFKYFPNIITEHWQTTKLIAFSATVVCIILVCVIGYIRFSHPKTENINISINKESSIKELKIVAISDVHLGYTIKKKRLQSYITKINSLQPDIVLIAGDLFDRSIVPVMQQKMDEDLSQIKSKYGTYAVFGNHEYYGHIAIPRDKVVQEFLNSTSIHFLKDQVICIDNDFYIVGRDDFAKKNRKSLAFLTTNLDKSKPIILLDHQPYFLEEANCNGIDLQISGHTHNGQIFPLNFIVNKMYELAYGYKKKGDTHYYVSSGLALWGAPFRIGTNSELITINLKFN